MIPKRWVQPVLALGLVLTGCAVTPDRAPPETPPEQTWRIRAARLSDIEAFRINTKLGVSAPERSGQGTMVWERSDAADRIDVFGPLGSGRVVLTRDADGAQVRDGDAVFTADSLEQALLDATGWRIPFAEMHYWVRGLPAPATPYTHQLDTDGRLRTLEQAGWRIRYDDYRTAADYQLPRKMTLKFSSAAPGGQPAAEVTVKLAIKAWRLSGGD